MTMTKTIWLAVLIVAGMAGAHGVDDGDDVIVGTMGERLEAWVRGAEAAGFRGAVLAARDGEVVLALGVGGLDERGKKPMTSATLFEIASVTKPFTAVAIMQLVEAGAVDLDASIAEYLRGVPKDCHAITVRHLLQHTSGIPGSNSHGSGSKLASVLPTFLAGGPKHEPGTHHEYWNQGYALVSEVIAEASGETYVDRCRAAIFEPAGMESSCFTGEKAPRGAVVATGMSKRGPARTALEHPYGSYGFQYRGMGGLVTNVWDLWRWDRALADGTLLGAEAQKEMFTSGPAKYALGWRIDETKGGQLVQFHTGGVRGFVSDVRRHPESDACLFVLCADDGFGVARFASVLEAVLLGEGAPDVAPPQKLDEDLADALEGVFEDDRGATLTVTRAEAVTRASILWYANGPTSNATLTMDDTGEVVFFEWTAAHVLEVERKGRGKVRNLSLLGRTFRR